jgi:hypothetical protein
MISDMTVLLSACRCRTVSDIYAGGYHVFCAAFVRPGNPQIRTPKPAAVSRATHRCANLVDVLSPSDGPCTAVGWFERAEGREKVTGAALYAAEV